MKTYVYTETELSEFANNTLDDYLGQLKDYQIISSEQYTELMQYRVVLSRPSFFGRMWRTLFRKNFDENRNYMTLIKTFPVTETESE